MIWQSALMCAVPVMCGMRSPPRRSTLPSKTEPTIEEALPPRLALRRASAWRQASLALVPVPAGRAVVF
ncbi:MAG: hypothetical protein R3F11_24835 [Verrucomicrobiales bacterium]